MEVFILFLDPFFTTKFFGYTLLWLYCFFFFLSIVLLISFQLRVCFVVMLAVSARSICCASPSVFIAAYICLWVFLFFLKFFTIFFYLVIDHMHGMLHLPFFLGLVFIYQLLFSSFFALLSQGTVEMMLLYWPFWNYMFQWQFVLLHSALHLCSVLQPCISVLFLGLRGNCS